MTKRANAQSTHIQKWKLSSIIFITLFSISPITLENQSKPIKTGMNQ